MNYKPGTAAFKMKALNLKNKYYVFVTCDTNDADYTRDGMLVDASKMSEVDFLMISYFNLNRYHIPKNWADVNDDRNSGFGGHYVMENEAWSKHTKGYEKYLNDRGFLLCSGDLESHSIDSILLTYFDENGKSFECEMIDLGKLFDSHKEFIEYVAKLKYKKWGFNSCSWDEDDEEEEEIEEVEESSDLSDYSPEFVKNLIKEFLKEVNRQEKLCHDTDWHYGIITDEDDNPKNLRKHKGLICNALNTVDKEAVYKKTGHWPSTLKPLDNCELEDIYELNCYPAPHHEEWRYAARQLGKSLVPPSPYQTDHALYSARMQPYYDNIKAMVKLYLKNK